MIYLGHWLAPHSDHILGIAMILSKRLPENTWKMSGHKNPLDIPAKHNLDTALSTIGLVNDEMISMENKISSPIITKIELYRCCVLLTLSAVSPVTVTVQNWSSANFVLPSPGRFANPRPKRIENRLHRSESPMPRPILFPSASLFFPAPNKNKKHQGKVQHLPKQHVTLMQKKIKLHFIHQKSQFLSRKLRPMPLDLPLAFFPFLPPLPSLVSREPESCWSVVETHLTPLIPNQIKQITHKQMVE